MKTDSPLYVFYSWNGEMENDEIVRQMKGFFEQGITGVFIHARAGLALPYFSEEWFEKFGFCLETAKSLGMEAGIYDENGWPSGFGGGAVNGLGEKYLQKKLVFSEERLTEEKKKLLSGYPKT
ncbi:MAG: glycoside hydrolase, partial [Candidatus Scatosoma sp.]